MFKYIFNQLKKHSTWLGIIGLVTACGATISAEIAEQIIAAGIAIAGAIGIETKDKENNTNG